MEESGLKEEKAKPIFLWLYPGELKLIEDQAKKEGYSTRHKFLKERMLGLCDPDERGKGSNQHPSKKVGKRSPKRLRFRAE